MARTKPKHISKADQALLERAVAAGCEAVRDDKGRIVVLFTKRVRMSATDCKRLRELTDESNAELVASGGEIWETPNPANLIGSHRYCMLKPMSAERKADAIRDSRFTGAVTRIEKLKRHPELHETTERLARSVPVEEGKFSSDPFWHDLAYAEMLAVAYDAAPRVTRDDGRQAGAKHGGKRAGLAAQKKAANWHADCVSKARELLKQGRAAHELTGILATRCGKTTRHVRTVLKQAGILPLKRR